MTARRGRRRGGPAAGLLVLLAGWLALSPLFASRATATPEEGPEPPSATVAAGTGEETDLIAVPAPPFSEGIFPCSDCHFQGEDVDTRRIPEDERYHTEVVFEHAPESRWCFDCHDASDRDRLHLADGTPVRFERSYELCGQCHGPKLRDWRAGDHGKRTGSWSGQKRYLLCVHCHDPHSPQFEPLEPMPPPPRPENVR